MAEIRTTRLKRNWLVPAVPFLAAAALIATPATAHGGRHHKHSKHARCDCHGHAARHPPIPVPIAWGWRGSASRPQLRSFVVPTVIVASDTRRLREWRHGYVYDPTHRHRHLLYAFPVSERGIWVSRPHAYCDGQLVSIPIARGRPGFGFTLGFGF